MDRDKTSTDEDEDSAYECISDLFIVKIEFESIEFTLIANN